MQKECKHQTDAKDSAFGGWSPSAAVKAYFRDNNAPKSKNYRLGSGRRNDNNFEFPWPAYVFVWAEETTALKSAATLGNNIIKLLKQDDVDSKSKYPKKYFFERSKDVHETVPPQALDEVIDDGSVRDVISAIHFDDDDEHNGEMHNFYHNYEATADMYFARNEVGEYCVIATDKFGYPGTVSKNLKSENPTDKPKDVTADIKGYKDELEELEYLFQNTSGDDKTNELRSQRIEELKRCIESCVNDTEQKTAGHSNNLNEETLSDSDATVVDSVDNTRNVKRTVTTDVEPNKKQKGKDTSSAKGSKSKK